MIAIAASSAADRSAQIRDFRASTVARRQLPKVVGVRTVVHQGRVITQHLLDLGQEFGRGSCCWVPQLPVAVNE
jgi:hypothetical protein